jgi:hypothetical protein
VHGIFMGRPVWKIAKRIGTRRAANRCWRRQIGFAPLVSGTSRRVPSSLRCNSNGPAHLELVFCFFFFFSFPVSASFLLFFYFRQNTDFKQFSIWTDFKWNKISNSKQNSNLKHILNGTYFKWNRFKFEQISNWTYLNGTDFEFCTVFEFK